ncbi:hypothetical protein ABG768_017722 [Culter alburnus]|uniref:P2X purinoreceptor 7 intracellular domain-containing protein n=1 Tax=Culter alburnus TaxID=194366 RepID=A0AAW1YVE2_CULAL
MQVVCLICSFTSGKRFETNMIFKIYSFQERIQSHQLLQRCLTRDPSLLFDIMDTQGTAVAPTPVPGQPTWCMCLHCREMPTDIERKCCGQHPNDCISTLPIFDLYITDEGVLRLSQRIWNNIRDAQDAPDPGENNKQFQHAAYRQYVVWQYGVLGPGHRVVIPSCCVCKIRERYPDPYGQYTSFMPSRV